MSWYLPILQFYRYFVQIGVTEELSFAEKLRIELSNQFILIALPAVIFNFIYNIIGPNALQEYLLTTLWLVILAIPLLLNHFRKFFFARLYIISIPLLLISVIFVLFGKSLRIDFLYPMFILISCFVFDRRTAAFAILIILLIYAYVNLHLHYFPPPLEAQIAKASTYIYFTYAAVTTVGLTANVIHKNQTFNHVVISRNQTLEEQNSELERFTYISSHDLKSPLSNIIGFSDLMEEELQTVDNPEILEYVSYIRTSSKQMYYLIEDIFELSKIQEGAQKNRVLIDLNKIAEKVTYTLTQEIQQKNAQVSYRKLPTFYCNEMEFALLFQNLIQNGIKYNENDSPLIEIWAKEKSGYIHLFFKDNGIGIAQQHHEEIFEYFHRLHHSDHYQGTGIGLGLCKKIVQNYKGRISVASQLTKGSTFTIQLPTYSLQV